MNELLPSDFIVKDEAYEHLLQEIKAIETERSCNERMERIYMYHEIGVLIRDFQQGHNFGVTQFIKELHKDLKYSERSLWFAKDFADKFPTIEEAEAALPDGKATSWTKVKSLLGGGEVKEDDTLDLTKVAKGLIKRYGLERAKMVAQIVMTTES